MNEKNNEKVITIKVLIDAFDPENDLDEEEDEDFYVDEEIFDDMTDLSRIIARDIVSLPEEVRMDYYEYFISELMSRLLEKGIDFWNEEDDDGEM